MKQDVLHSSRARRRRVNDPEGTKRNIIEIATEEFAGKGLSGARVDDIAARTKTSKRMIYYYFGGKEGLYIAVLEAAYRSIRSVEATQDLEHQEPERALRTLVSFTWDYQNAHPEFIRLVMNENILNGAFLSRSRTIQRLNATAIDVLRDLLVRGQRKGAFRSDIDRWTCTCRSAPCAFSTWPTGRRFRPSSSVTWARPGRWPRAGHRWSR